MKSYPVSVPRKLYGGREERKLAKVREHNRVAAKVQAYLNDDLANRPQHSVTIYASDEVAKAIGEDSELVHAVIFLIDCGANGVTIVKGDYALAMKEFSSGDEA